MKDAADKRLLREYLDGRVDNSMSSVVQGWLYGALANPDLDAELERQFDRMVVFSEPTLHTYERWRKLEQKLAFVRHITSRPVRKRALLRVAAVLIPALVIAGALIYSERWWGPTISPMAENAMIDGISISTEAGRQRKIELEDNSQVTVNENSRIVYNEDFDVTRKVYVEGEAHFVVEKDPARPFYIYTKYVTVEVTGTEFNIRAVEGEERMTVSLTRGSVKIVANDEETSLEQGYEFEFDYESRQSGVEPYSGTGWWVQPITFREMTLREIFDNVEAYYGVTLEGKENFADSLRYNIRFDRGESMENILGTVSRYSGRFTFSGTGETVVITKKDRR